ncbi:hypothetical protein J6590_034000 [Homalodisca vitripennis]|nr:hypothetical protein J6590_034000 [Homalodisca vitripennis]
MVARDQRCLRQHVSKSSEEEGYIRQLVANIVDVATPRQPCDDSDSDEWEEESGSDENKEPIADTSDSGEDDLTGIIPFDFLTETVTAAVPVTVMRQEPARRRGDTTAEVVPSYPLPLTTQHNTDWPLTLTVLTETVTAAAPVTVMRQEPAQRYHSSTIVSTPPNDAT